MPSGLPEVQSSVILDSRSCVNRRKSLVYMEITTKSLFLNFKSWSFDLESGSGSTTNVDVGCRVVCDRTDN